jgi:hypothetical protein
MGHSTETTPKTVALQSHSKFKVFIPEDNLSEQEATRRLNTMLTAWTKDGKVAPKSVGVEYLEASKRLVLSIGYRDDEQGYAVKLTTISLGKPNLFPDAIETAMNKAAESLDADVICHEFFVTGEGEFVMVFMSHETLK